MSNSVLKRVMGAAAALLLIVNLSACQSSPSTTAVEEESKPETSANSAGTYKLLTAAEAQARMSSGDPVTIVDVRTPEEFSEGYIVDAINLPLDRIAQEAGSILTDKNAEILVYCRSGNRSKSAAQELIKMGYTNVYDFGGISSWTGEIVKP